MAERRIVLAHDYLTQRGGAERVMVDLCRIFRPSELVTAVYNPRQTFEEFANEKILTSGLNRITAFQNDPRLAFPFLASAWSKMPAIDADVVICSSSGWSHGVRVRPGAKKIVYCHNPARWLYQTQDYLLDGSLSAKTALKILKSGLLRWDKAAALTAHCYIANSTSVAQRIKSAYGISAEVIFPPVSVDTDGIRSAPAGLENLSNFFLTIGRARGYKGTDVLVEAFRKMPGVRLLVVGLHSGNNWPTNVVGLGRVSDANLRWLYSKARALISVSREDFGLTPIEANCFGTPALLLRAGGFVDSTVEGVSGMFIEESSTDAIMRAVYEFPDEWDRRSIVEHSHGFSREEFARRLGKFI